MERRFVASKPEWTKKTATRAAFGTYQALPQFLILKDAGWLVEVDKYGSGWAIYLVRECRND